ncbi:MAG: winged helix-turn-helix domain-containing protein [Candidatus Thorarchaeota archaeon]
MTSSRADNRNADDDGISEASLFETISHDTRIRLLFLLRERAYGFAELKRKLGISSSGNLQHHISKLLTLIHLNNDGMYALTDNGREAILTVQAVRNMQNRYKSILNTMTLIAAFAYYVVMMNVPFLTGTVNSLTPVYALAGSVLFTLIFYVLWKAVFAVIKDRKIEIQHHENGE